MTRLILTRLAQLPLVLLAVYTLTLALAWAIPGNPLENSERRPPPEVEAAMKAQYNLDSFGSFYWSYLDSATGLRAARDHFSGRSDAERQRLADLHLAPPPRRVFDLGPSLQYRDQRVSEIIAGSLPVSAQLGVIAIILAILIGTPAGVLGGVRPGTWIDSLSLAIALIGISLPSFVTGTLLVLVFPVWLGLGKVGGWGSLSQMLLPALTLSLPFAAYIARLTRMGMVEAMSSDYVRTARAKGLPESAVVMRHALKNAALPVVSYLGPACAMAMTGSFVVERVFNVPGLGQHFVNAVQNKDLFLIIGVVLVFSTMLVLFNLVVDVLYRWIDPRIKV